MVDIVEQAVEVCSETLVNVGGTSVSLAEAVFRDVAGYLSRLGPVTLQNGVVTVYTARGMFSQQLSQETAAVLLEKFRDMYAADMD